MFMDSGDDDMFAFSDEDLPISTPKCNPVEEHLMKQLSDVQSRIQKATNDVKEIQDTTRRILKSLYAQAEYGEDITSESDSDLYTIDGQPVIKKKKYKILTPNQILVVQGIWKRVVYDQWVIGVILKNTSMHTLSNVQIYVSTNGENEMSGMSAFWYLENETFWCPADTTILPHKKVVATVALELPKFDKNPFCDAYGTVSYETNDKEYQTPIPVIRLAIEETIDDNYGITFSSELDKSVLALKVTSVEKSVGIQIERNPGRGAELLKFLEQNSFKEISTDVYVVQTTGCLMHCLVEILPITGGEARLKIFSRSCQQMNVMSRLLKNQFPDSKIEETVNPLRAAMTLMEELKLYLEDASSAERQMARIRTDLLIP